MLVSHYKINISLFQLLLKTYLGLMWVLSFSRNLCFLFHYISINRFSQKKNIYTVIKVAT